MDVFLNLLTATNLTLNTSLILNSNVPHQTPYHDSKSFTRLSRVEVFLESKIICNKPTPSNTTQYPDLFITYKDGFNVQTGKGNTFQLPEDEQYNRLSIQLFSGPKLHTHYNIFFSCSKLLKQICRF